MYVCVCGLRLSQSPPGEGRVVENWGLRLSQSPPGYHIDIIDVYFAGLTVPLFL